MGGFTVTKKISGGRVKIDRSRLLGFDQASEAPRAQDPKARPLRLAKVGAKVGGKPGVKLT
jgi:hypothetical protein